MSEILLIRADASQEIGYGHVMRCLALAEQWESAGHSAVFAMAECCPDLELLVLASGYSMCPSVGPAGSVADIDRTIEIARQRDARAVVLDGRHFHADFQRGVSDAGFVVMVLDDHPTANPYCTDLLWNADLPIQHKQYSQLDETTTLLLGPSFALLRRQFLQSVAIRRAVPDCARNLLITMGGSDPQNMTGKIIGSLKDTGEFKVRAVIGKSNPNGDAIRHLARELGHIEVLTEVKDMPAQMGWADMAVVAAGVTLWELLYMGVPVVCWPRYPEDRELLSMLAREGAALPFPESADPSSVAALLKQLALDRQGRQRMSDNSRALIDGRGSERVVDCLLATVRRKPKFAKAILR